MPSPFFYGIKGTTAGAAGTGAFTPNAASTGFVAWSTIPTGWIGLVRFEDGTAWELCYCYWNGTTLSRASTQVAQGADGALLTSTAAQLTLTSAATAAMVEDPTKFVPAIGSGAWRGFNALPTATIATPSGLAAVTITGTAAAPTVNATSYFTEQNRSQQNSLTTINAQAGWSHTANNWIYSTTAGRGGAELYTRWGADALPASPRLFIGWAALTVVGVTTDLSAHVNTMAFLKDAADTNIQFASNDASGTATKTDTGIPLTASGWYESRVWWEPGGGRVFGLLIRMDTGAIWMGNRSTDLPATGTLMRPMVIGGLSAASTVFQMGIASMFMRGGA